MKNTIIRLFFIGICFFIFITEAKAFSVDQAREALNSYRNCSRSISREKLDSCCNQYEANVSFDVCREINDADSSLGARCRGQVSANYIKCIKFSLPKKRVTSAIRQMI
jgi:hypothetical protein